MNRLPSPTLFSRVASSLSIKPEDGVPHVADLPSDLISQAGQPYMRRYFLLGAHSRAAGETARFHQILRSDLEVMHDHPWDFISVILHGTYTETTPTTEQTFGPGSVLVRKAEQLHRLTLPDGPVWTFITMSHPRRRWGFQTDDGWMHWSAYLNSTVNGHIGG